MSNIQVSQELGHFAATHRQDIIEGKEALVAGDMNRVKQILDKLENSEVVKSITNMAANAGEFLDGIMDQVRRVMPGANMIRGLVIVAAGAAFWGAQGALAPIIGFCLIAYGISVAFPAVQQLIHKRFESLFDDLS